LFSGLPASAQAGVVAFVLLLLTSTVAWFVWLLRPARRTRLVRLRAIPLALCAVLAAAPWIYVKVFHVRISISIDGAWELALLAIELVLVYAFWIVAPLTYVIVALVWLRTRQHARRREAPATPTDLSR
jgi:hypothetical protein